MGGSPSDGIVTATVAGGILVSCEVEGGFRNAVCDLVESTPVETLFDWVAGYEPSFTTVRYDTERGIPMRINYDDPNYIDEEYRIVVKEFTETG